MEPIASPVSRSSASSGLDGSIRRVPGVVPLVDALGDHVVVVPPGCGGEAALVARGLVRSVRSLVELVAAALGGRARGRTSARTSCRRRRPSASSDLADVRGHVLARTRRRSRCRWRSPPPAARPTRRGQDHAGPATSRSAAAARPRDLARDHDDPLRRGPSAARRPGPSPAVASPSPHRVPCGDGRGRYGGHAPGRGVARPRRRAVPRRGR